MKKGQPFPDHAKPALRAANLGKKISLETRAKMSAARIGRKFGPYSAAARARMSAGQMGRTGPRSSAWRGGISTENALLRNTPRAKEWSRAVKERDNYTCQMCGKRGGALNADHIKPFALYPELRLDLTNGRTLCVQCHRKTPTYAGRTRIAA